MKYKLSILILSVSLIIFTILLFIFDWNKSPNTKNFDAPGETIVAFGDSLVVGVGSSESGGFVSILEDRLLEPIINLGKSGDTTKTALNRLDSVIEKNPKLVIILLGGNDFLQKVPVEETFQNLQLIVDTIYDHGGAVLILGIRGGILKDSYDDYFKEFTKRNNTAFVPNVLDGILGNNNLMSDSIHPNYKGYLKIADKVEPILRKILTK